MDKKFKKIFLLSSLVLSSVLLASCYITSQASAFLSLQSKARSNDTVLKDPNTDAATRDFLNKVNAIRLFGINELGLKDTQNYTSYVQVAGDRLVTVVQACAELSFTRYLWDYPIMGKLPYMGFFEEKDAVVERDRLKKLGYDTIMRPVDAFSTLGWFKDPLYSFMMKESDAELSDTIMHEMMHATAFSKATGDFNEEMATFVGRKASEHYVLKTKGATSKEYQDLIMSQSERASFALYLRGTATLLEAVYKNVNLSDEEKRAKKKEIITARAADFIKNYDQLFKTQGYKQFPMERINNAYLDLFRLYEGEPELYEAYYTQVTHSDLKQFITAMVEVAKTKDPKATMRSALR